MKRLIIIAITIFLAAITAAQHIPTLDIFPVRAGIDPIEKIQSSEEDDVRRAIEDALVKSSSYFISGISDMIRVDNVTISEDGNWATAWLVLSDPTTGDPLPSEPGLAIAKWDATQWLASLPGDPTYSLSLTNAPQELINYDTRIDYLAINRIQSETEVSAPLSGYLLPWRAGETVYLSRSVAHDADITSGNAHYSFDFYISKTMFNIHAAKSGTVYLWRDDVPNDNHESVNYIVLKDTTTYPVTYQLYLHLAQNSIPPALKIVGAPVAQGQYIGIADNTGASTGHHLHFQVENTPYWSYWGVSVDIQFSDVAINSGRPRVEWDEPYCRTDDVCDEFSPSYVSANVPPGDITPPIGDVLSPKTGEYITNNTLDLDGWAADGDSGLNYARFKAKIEGEWQPIGPIFTSSPFSYQWDLCEQNVPDGPISLALDIRDNDGNLAAGLPGLRHIIKEYQCSDTQPVCSPGPNQIALYSEADFQGTCTLLEHPGNPILINTLGAVGVNEATSLQVGSNSLATLFDNSDGSARGETFSEDDANLSDNRIGSDRASSVAIYPQTYKPAVPQPLWPLYGSTHREYTSQTLVADDRGGAQEFRFEVNGERREWQSTPILNLGSNLPGEYLWKMQARNAAGESSWITNQQQFTVTSNPTTPSIVTAPYSDDMENGTSGWVNSSYWDQDYISTNPNGGAISWIYDTSSDSGYDTGETNYGDLTSPPINIPQIGYYLRFWYRFETESTNSQWDQRWVQISRNGGKFVNLLQLYDDPPNWWLRSPVIDLSDYVGDTIQIRFHFETLDNRYNDYVGWYIDDLSIDQSPPPDCSTSIDAGDTPALAQPISYNQEITAEICPGGDVDYYSFEGTAGDHIGATTQAQQIGSDLDTYIFLLDSDGTSVVTENDDIVYAEQTDSQFSYTLNRTGEYFLKVRAWNHPTAGGETYKYTTGIYNDGGKPLAAFTNPPGATYLPTNGVSLLIQANDIESGMSHVDFYWHSGDWQNSHWIYLDTDSDGADGWSTYFDTSSISDQREIAFYSKAFDYAGNRKDVAVWDFAIDHTPPTTQLQSLPGSTMSSVIHLVWSGADNLAGMGYYDLQAKIDDGSWQTWAENIPADQTEKWFLVETGHSYAFRIRGVDLVGNQEEFSLIADTSTIVPEVVCSQGDQWEINNTSDSATLLNGLVTNQNHNFCNPLDNSSWQGDEDWGEIFLRAGYPLYVDVIPNDGSAPAEISLFDSLGGKIMESPSSDYGQPTSLKYIAPNDQTVFLRITPIDERITGDDASYQVFVQVGYLLYLPTINK